MNNPSLQCTYALDHFSERITDADTCLGGCFYKERIHSIGKVPTFLLSHSSRVFLLWVSNRHSLMDDRGHLVHFVS